jgi:AraC-like DNA-binding protein
MPDVTGFVPRRAESALTPPSADVPRATIGTLLDPPFVDRLARATANVARLLALSELGAADVCDLLVLDPRRLVSSVHESAVVRRHADIHVPCIYYTESSQLALRSVVAASDVTPVRLVLFDVDDDPITFHEVIGLAPRHAHASRLRTALKSALQPLLPSVRTTLDTILRRPEQFFDASDVALRAGLSRRHLDRLLTAADLAPAKNWVVGARAWHAAYLLVCGRLSVEATASRLGYADAKALRRHLAAVWSSSPSQLACADVHTLLRDMVAFLTTCEPEGDATTS